MKNSTIIKRCLHTVKRSQSARSVNYRGIYKAGIVRGSRKNSRVRENYGLTRAHLRTSQTHTARRLQLASCARGQTGIWKITRQRSDVDTALPSSRIYLLLFGRCCAVASNDGTYIYIYIYSTLSWWLIILERCVIFYSKADELRKRIM